MKRGIYLAVLSVVVLGVVIVTTGEAQVYPVRWDEQQAAPQRAAHTPPSLVLADGGIEFPDGSVQSTAAQVVLIGPALVPVTGQTACYDVDGVVVTCGTGIGLGQDGDLQMGVNWPNPRFTDNANGTVTDNLTGLIWLKRANCFTEQTWAVALAKANALFDGCTDCGIGHPDCGLSDGSVAGQWRLPSVRELQSLVHYAFSGPALPNTAGTGQWVEDDPFNSVQSAYYWSSTALADSTVSAWGVSMYGGNVDLGGYKTSPNRVWLVRGGQ